MSLPALRFGDVYSEGTIRVANIPGIAMLDGIVFKGGYKAKHPATLSDFASFAVDLEAWVEIESGDFTELEIFLGIKIKIPSEVGFTLKNYDDPDTGEHVFEISVYFYIKEKYKFSVSFSTHSGFALTAEAQNMGLLEFITDLTPFDPFAIVEIMAKSEFLNKIKLYVATLDIIGMVKLLFETIFICDSFAISIGTKQVVGAFVGCGVGPFKFTAAMVISLPDAESESPIPGLMVYLEMFHDPNESFEKLFRNIEDTIQSARDNDSSSAVALGSDEAVARDHIETAELGTVGEYFEDVFKRPESKFELPFTNPFEDMAKEIEVRFMTTNSKTGKKTLSIAVVGYFLDLATRPFGTALRSMKLAISTTEINEFSSMVEGINPIFYLPAGFSIAADTNLLYLMEAPFKPLVAVIDSCTSLLSENSPLMKLMSDVKAPFAFLEHFPVMVYFSFDLQSATFSVGTGVAMDFGDVYIIPSFGFNTMSFYLEAEIGAESTGFSMSGSASFKFQVDPPVAALKAVFTKKKKDCVKEEGVEDCRTDPPKWIDRAIGEGLDKPTVVVGKGEMFVTLTPLGFVIGLSTSATMENKKDVMWINPFMVMPRVAIVFPWSFALDFRIQECITAIVAAVGGTAAAVTGIGIIATIATWFNTFRSCIPKKLEIEAGLAGCASNFVVDGMTARFFRGFYISDEAELGEGSNLEPLARMGSTLDALPRVGSGLAVAAPSLAMGSAFARVGGDSPARALPRLGGEYTGQEGTTGGNDARFDEEKLSRYHCGARDPYGPEPMMAAVSIQFAFSLNFRAGFLMRFKGIKLGRLIGQFFVNPLAIFSENPEDADGGPLFKVVWKMFLSVFDAIYVEDVQMSFNLFPIATKMSSGTTIPAGMGFDIRGVSVLWGLISLPRLSLSIMLLSLKPAIDANVWFAPVDINLGGGIKFVLKGVQPSRRRALKGVLDAQKKGAAKEAAAAQRALAEAGEMTGLGGKDGLGCPGNICKTCATFPGGTTAVITCIEGQKIVGFTAAAWGLAATQPSWSFEDEPSACSYLSMPTKGMRQGLALSPFPAQL